MESDQKFGRNFGSRDKQQTPVNSTQMDIH